MSHCLPLTAGNQVFVTVPAQQLLPVMHYQQYYPGYAPAQSVPAGQPNLAPPPSYYEASEFHLHIHCSLSKQTNIGHDFDLCSDKMANHLFNSPSNVQAGRCFPPSRMCILHHNQLRAHSCPTTPRTSRAFQQAFACLTSDDCTAVKAPVLEFGSPWHTPATYRKFRNNVSRQNVSR